MAVGGVELCYQLDGSRGDPLVLLVNGLGGQLIGWREGFLAALLERGVQVLRFDNRDAGLSTSFDGAPGFDADVARRRDRDAVAYTLDDMADDAAGLLEALDIAAAHVVGVSMGGMIAQTLAIRRPDLVRSLCSIMSMTGADGVGTPTETAMAVLMRPPSTDRAGYVAAQLDSHRVLGSPSFPTAPEVVAERAGVEYDRSFRPEGTARQLMAILVSGDRTEALASVAAPTVVIHGDADQLITPGGAEATAAAVPGARLVMIAGMGHELPEGTWDQVADEIVANVRRGEGASR